MVESNWVENPRTGERWRLEMRAELEDPAAMRAWLNGCVRLLASRMSIAPGCLEVEYATAVANDPTLEESLAALEQARLRRRARHE
jgi:hypothetical protein